MRTAEEIRICQLHVHGTSISTNMTELFLKFVEDKINTEVISNKFDDSSFNYDDYYDKNWKGTSISEEYKNKYGLKFTVKDIADYYNLPNEYFKNFTNKIKEGIKELENKGYTVIYYNKNKEDAMYTEIYVLWVNQDMLKEIFN